MCSGKEGGRDGVYGLGVGVGRRARKKKGRGVVSHGLSLCLWCLWSVWCWLLTLALTARVLLV